MMNNYNKYILNKFYTELQYKILNGFIMVSVPRQFNYIRKCVINRYKFYYTIFTICVKNNKSLLLKYN